MHWQTVFRLCLREHRERHAGAIRLRRSPVPERQVRRDHCCVRQDTDRRNHPNGGCDSDSVS